MTLNAIKLRLIAWLARSLTRTRPMPLPENVTEGFRRLHKAARQQATVLACIKSLAEVAVENNQELNDELDRTEAAVDADETQDDLDIGERDATIKAQQTLIEELKAGQIDVPATIARLQTIQGKLHKGGTTQG